jgi:hypothetical protein
MPAISVHKAFAPLAVLPLLLPGAALAAAATALQNVNVRSGPSTDYSVVTLLHQGDAVDVRQCEGLFCQVTFGGKSGWVSASYLTRDYVPRTPAAPSPDQQQIAATPSPPANGSFPPAYDPSAGDAAPADLASTDTTMDAGGYTPADPALSSVTLPADSGQTIVSVGAPRPKADVPGGAITGPDDEAVATDGPYPLDSPGGSFDIPAPAGDRAAPGWGSRFGRFGWRAGVGPADDPALAARACLLPESGGRGLCVRAGQTARDLVHGGYDVAWLRNPDHLAVTVCTTFGDCSSYEDSGPLDLSPGEAVSSISADMPAY